MTDSPHSLPLEPAASAPLPAGAPVIERIEARTARRRLRILIIVENLPVPPDRRVWQEALALTRAGHEVSIISPKGKGWTRGYEVIDGIHIHRHPLPHEARGMLAYPLEYGAALFWELVLAWRIFVTRGFDVIQACNPPDLIFLVAALFRPFGVKFVFDHHDLAPELFEVKFGRKGLLHRTMLLCERLTFRMAGMVISTNEAFRTIAMERGGKRPEDVTVVLSSPDPARFAPARPNPDLKKGRRHMVLFVGVMGSQDGLDLLLAAAATMITRHGRQDAQFVLAGDGPERPALEERARTLGIADFVTFTGYVTGGALAEAFATADVGVVPDPKNRFNDHLTMNKILEYMAFSLPMVSFDLTVSRQLADGAAVFVSDNDTTRFAEELGRLLDDPERRARLGRHGHDRLVGELSWDRQIDKLLACYDRLGGA